MQEKNNNCSAEESLAQILMEMYNQKLALIEQLDKSLSKTYPGVSRQDEHDIKQFMRNAKRLLQEMDTVNAMTTVTHMEESMSLLRIVRWIDMDLAFALGNYIAMLSLYLSLHGILSDDELAEHIMCILSGNRKELADNMFKMWIEQVSKRLGA